MRLCWDNLEGVYLTKNNNFRKGNHTYIVKTCKNCGNLFLALRMGYRGHSVYCCKKCSRSNQVCTIETRKKMSKAHLGRTCYSTKAMNKSISKGDVVKLNIALYDTYAHQLRQFNFEEVRVYMLLVDGVVYKTLQVRCNESGCRAWFNPTRIEVRHRLQVFNGTLHGQQNFYCSNECKQTCSTFGQIDYPKGFKTYKNQRPDQPQWRKMVLERDNYTCQICGFHSPDGKGLVAHHIEAVVRNPIESMDIDNGLTLCDDCDNMIHKLPGCSPYELRCKK